MPASAAGPCPERTPARRTRSPSANTWVRTTSSTARSPTLPSATPTRPSRTIRNSGRPSGPDGSKSSKASRHLACRALALLAGKQAELLGAFDGLAARGHAQLAVDGYRLGLDGMGRQVQPLADLPERQVGGQQG